MTDQRPREFPALGKPRAGAVDLTLRDFASRAFADDLRSLAGVRVRLTGFAVTDPALDNAYRLTRFALACCAADALPIQVEVRGEGTIPADDTWVEVVGTWVEPDDPALAIRAVLASSVQRTIDEPRDPYE